MTMRRPLSFPVAARHQRKQVVAALHIHGDVENGAVLGFKDEVHKILVRLEVELAHVHIVLIAGGGGDVEDGKGHVEAVFIDGVEGSNGVLPEKIQIAEVVQIAEHGAVAHVVAVDDRVLVQRVDAVALVEEGRALGRLLAEEVVGKVVFVVALDDGELYVLRRVQIGDGLRVGLQQLGKGGLRLGQRLLRAGGGVVKLAHRLVGVLALFAHAVLPEKQRRAGEGDEQAEHPQDEIDRSLSLCHGRFLRRRACFRRLSVARGRALSFADVAAPLRDGHGVVVCLALIRARTCA